MAHLEAATEFVLGIISQNEGVKNPSNDFVTASMTWIRSSFLTDDPITSTILENKDLPETVKKTVLEAKLKTLENNPQFKKALDEKLQAFIRYKAHLKSAVDAADIAVKGNAHTEDNNNAPDDNYFRLGKEGVQTDDNVQTHNGLSRKSTFSSGEKAPSPYQKVKIELKSLLAKGKAAVVIQSLLDDPENRDETAYNTILILSAKLNRVLEQKKRGIIGADEATIERNKINEALTIVIDCFYE